MEDSAYWSMRLDEHHSWCNRDKCDTALWMSELLIDALLFEELAS